MRYSVKLKINKREIVHKAVEGIDVGQIFLYGCGKKHCINYLLVGNITECRTEYVLLREFKTKLY